MSPDLPGQVQATADGPLRHFTVQCGYGSWMACTVIVEANSIGTACDLAIEQANDSQKWKSTDSCGPTSIDAIAEGCDVDPWSNACPALPIPLRFKEHAEAETLRLALSRLLAWADYRGGCNASCWIEARALLPSTSGTGDPP